MVLLSPFTCRFDLVTKRGTTPTSLRCGRGHFANVPSFGMQKKCRKSEYRIALLRHHSLHAAYLSVYLSKLSKLSESILLARRAYKHVRSAVFPVAFGSLVELLDECSILVPRQFSFVRVRFCNTSHWLSTWRIIKYHRLLFRCYIGEGPTKDRMSSSSTLMFPLTTFNQSVKSISPKEVLDCPLC